MQLAVFSRRLRRSTKSKAFAVLNQVIPVRFASTNASRKNQPAASVVEQTDDAALELRVGGAKKAVQTSSAAPNSQRTDAAGAADNDDARIRLEKSRSADSKYCVDAVRKYDYENYLCTLRLPVHLRQTAFALRAFNVELSQIRDQVSQRLIGDMRLQFWSDSIDRIFTGGRGEDSGGESGANFKNEMQKQVRDSPVVRELYRVCRRHEEENGIKLSKHWFKTLISARRETMSDKPFDSLPNAEKYFDKSIAPVFYILLQAARVQSTDADHVASHVAKAIGLTNLVRGVPFNARRNRCYLPLDLLLQHNVRQDDFVRVMRKSDVADDAHRKNCDVVFDVCAQAHVHLHHAREHAEKVKSADASSRKSVWSIVGIPAVACQHFLTRIQLSHFNVFDAKLSVQDGKLLFKLIWADLFRKKF